MSFIRLFIVVAFLGFSHHISANALSGVIEARGKVPTGVLYIIAKKHDGSLRMPLAVKRIQSPKFPLKFSLDKSNKMMADLPFKGPFLVTARISPSGNALDKSGVEAKTKKPIKLGDKNIKIILKKK